jgi:UDP-N-acetylmuramoylalanine--D-glutamate ligase
MPIIGELELAAQHSRCPSIAITGTNGKTTTTELVERILLAGGRRTVAAGNIGRPFSDVVEKTAELDFVTLEVSSFQLETIQTFSPVIGVLMNITPDHLDRYPSMAEYIRAKERLFENQTATDSAVIQSEALKLLNAQKIHIPSRILTFSATDQSAELYLDGTRLMSRSSESPRPLLDMCDCQLRGPHNAENLMAALAVGHLVGLPLEKTVEGLKTYQPAAHRCELVAEIKGVKFVNDSKATNVDAVQKALLTVGDAERANVWLIAGGKDKGFDYSEIGPVLAKRVKGAFLIGETREKIFFAWNEFISCTREESLLEAFRRAADCAVAGDVVLLSPACSSFDQFQNYQHRGEVFRQAVAAWREEVTGRPLRMSRENGSAVLMM